MSSGPQIVQSGAKLPGTGGPKLAPGEAIVMAHSFQIWRGEQDIQFRGACKVLINAIG